MNTDIDTGKGGNRDRAERKFHRVRGAPQKIRGILIFLKRVFCSKMLVLAVPSVRRASSDPTRHVTIPSVINSKNVIINQIKMQWWLRVDVALHRNAAPLLPYVSYIHVSHSATTALIGGCKVLLYDSLHASRVSVS